MPKSAVIRPNRLVLIAEKAMRDLTREIERRERAALLLVQHEEVSRER